MKGFGSRVESRSGLEGFAAFVAEKNAVRCAGGGDKLLRVQTRQKTLRAGKKPEKKQTNKQTSAKLGRANGTRGEIFLHTIRQTVQRIAERRRRLRRQMQGTNFTNFAQPIKR
jgi:hypothetical protein